ncbi:hypothetical protein ACFP2T_42010, partial [Plantactinospora solaniradicis]
LNDVTPRKKRPELSAEEQAAADLVRLAKEQGLSLTGPDGHLPVPRIVTLLDDPDLAEPATANAALPVDVMRQRLAAAGATPH